MTNTYLKLKQKHQKETNEFPMMFAFSKEQFKEGMEKLGLTEKDTDKIYSIGYGGYIRKTDGQALTEMRLRHDKERQEQIDNDLTGEGYIYDMFNYELANHEYGYTLDVEDTLNALGITYDDLKQNERLSHGLKKAKAYQRSKELIY